MTSPDWPTPPNPNDASQQLELFKSQLDVHTKRIEAGIAAEAAATAHAYAIEQSELLAGIETVKESDAADALAKAAAAKADVDRAAARAVAEVARGTADYSFHDNMSIEFYKAYIEIAKGTVERSQKRVEMLQAAALAIGGLYTGIAAYIFKTADKAAAGDAALGIKNFPNRGVIPTMFLGAAIVFAMAYLSFLTQPRAGDPVEGIGSIRGDLNQQRNNFVKWMTDVPWWRTGCIQLAVISLGLGVAFLPIAFTNISDHDAFRAAIIASTAVIVIWMIGWISVGLNGRFSGEKQMPKAGSGAAR
jgi:hypothetical protein